MLWNNQCLNWFRQDFRQETPPHILQAARRVAGIALAPDAGPVVCPLRPSMSIVSFRREKLYEFWICLWIWIKIWISRNLTNFTQPWEFFSIASPRFCLSVVLWE